MDILLPRSTELHLQDEICALLGYYTASSGSSTPTFRHNISVPISRVKESKKKAFFFELLTLEDGTDMLCRNVGVELPLDAV
jgi:hypothetical protein